MKIKKILILEDMEERVLAFRSAIAKLAGVEMLLWRDAESMVRDLSEHLSTASMISLDHDILPSRGMLQSPGTGLDVCKALARHRPSCPVVLHTANYIKVWPMMYQLAFAKWEIHRTPPVRLDERWIESVWLPRVRMLLNAHSYRP